jgi:hypothetical protein
MSESISQPRAAQHKTLTTQLTITRLSLQKSLGEAVEIQSAIRQWDQVDVRQCQKLVEHYLVLRGELDQVPKKEKDLSALLSRHWDMSAGIICCLSTIREHEDAYRQAWAVSEGVSAVLRAGFPERPLPDFICDFSEEAQARYNSKLEEYNSKLEEWNEAWKPFYDREWLTGRFAEKYPEIRQRVMEVPIINLPQMFSAMAHGGDDLLWRLKVSTAAETISEHHPAAGSSFAPIPPDITILTVLAQTCAATCLNQIVTLSNKVRKEAREEGSKLIPVSDSVVKQRVPVLEKARLIERPKRKDGTISQRKGVAITSAGRALLTHFANSQP